MKEGLELRILKILLSGFLIIVLSSFMLTHVGAVSLYTDGAYTFADIDQDNVALYGYDNSSSVLTIPTYYSGRRVSAVYDYAFQNNEAITRIDFSENPRFVSAIGIKSFAECTGLTGDLSLPSSIRTLGLGAFQGCGSITSLTVNTGLKSIPVQCFNRCGGLETVYLPANLESIDNLAFANCEKLYDVYLPSSVTYISDSAFMNTYPTLHVYYNSYAHRYAVDNNILYELLDGVRLGDVNGDGSIDVNDVTMIQKHIAGLTVLDGIYLYSADTNLDTDVDIIDATVTQKHIAGYELAYPVGEIITR